MKYPNEQTKTKSSKTPLKPKDYDYKAQDIRTWKKSKRGHLCQLTSTIVVNYCNRTFA